MTVPTPTTPVSSGPHRVVVLVVDGVGLAELGQVEDVFRVAAEAPGQVGPRYELLVCAPHPGRVRSREGHHISVTAGLDALRAADTVALPGCRPIGIRHDPEVVAAVRVAHARGARVVATCTGVSLAAAADVFDGRTATTHWSHTEALRDAYPDLAQEPGVLYLDHGDVVTGAGAGAGLDVYLHLLRADHGAALAAAVARRLVTGRQRDGALPQLLTDPVPSRTGEHRLDPLTVVLEHLGAHLGDREPLATVAARVGMSERTLHRRFTQQLGTTPGRWLITERLRQARHLLETTDLPVENVAHRLGLTSATALRRQFRRELATSPSRYRTDHRRPIAAEPEGSPPGEVTRAGAGAVPDQEEDADELPKTERPASRVPGSPARQARPRPLLATSVTNRPPTTMLGGGPGLQG